MHQDYFTSLSREFMRGMTDFLPEHRGTYFIARDQVEPSKELLELIFKKLDYWLEQETDDITTKQFLKLLAYLRVVFLQDSVLLRSQYPQHSLWLLSIFKHPLYVSFAVDVAASLNDEGKNMNSQIRTVIPILGQQILNLNTSLTDLLIENFKNQQHQAMKMESKLNDFLESKIAFQMTPIKRQKLLHMVEEVKTSETFIEASISIDSRLLFSPSTATSKASLSFVSPSKKTISSRFMPQKRATSPPSTYMLSRNVHTVVDLFKK